MPPRFDEFDAPLGRLDHLLATLHAPASVKPAIEQWRSNAAALRFHLRPRDPNKPLLLAVVGGTGTGKSTTVNRILGIDASATSFRRTFTTGCVAIARTAADVPRDWMGVEHLVLSAEQLPARGQNGAVVVVPRSAFGSLGGATQDDLLARVAIIDTPDLDGDQPLHHAEADRAFRWAQALIFLVTPEKYQMTELLPYYRLAARYGLPALFVMNKCEEQAVVEDYRRQLTEHLAEGVSPQSRGEAAAVFAIPRYDSAYSPPPGDDLAALRQAIAKLDAPRAASLAGLANRSADVASRLQETVLAPLRAERDEAERLAAALHEMETPTVGVDVNPVTQDLERRLQQRSVLYLIGPRRVLDRVRQAPTLMVRLPRMAWDFVMRGKGPPPGALSPADEIKAREAPNFATVLVDQFSIVQSRIDDLLRTSPIAQKWIAAGPAAFEQAKLAPQLAGKIADEELAELRAFLEKRWNATPWDTRIVQGLLKHLPGGSKLTNISEAAPYLLAVALIAHHAMFGTDLLVLGGYTLATWLTERLSNEVANRTRAANSRIADRFTRLVHEQIQKMSGWISQQAVAKKAMDQLERAGGDLSDAVSRALPG